MTPLDLLDALTDFSPDTALVFVADDWPIGAGYHVTEVKFSAVQSVDCAGRKTAWDEITVQLLDGAGDAHMSVGKFRGILSKALGAVDAPDGVMRFEFSPSNGGLRLFEPGTPELTDGQVMLPLLDLRPACKPSQAFGATKSTANSAVGCCGVQVVAGCCG